WQNKKSFNYKSIGPHPDGDKTQDQHREQSHAHKAAPTIKGSQAPPPAHTNQHPKKSTSQQCTTQAHNQSTNKKCIGTLSSSQTTHARSDPI
ncbi:hypothetical protein, partial [Corynebacterium bouchesdurhonense]|uniref:hypothetical protein n=1 Tax=Corynebacterium bouchesdurhonense TaxID=1720192 RepID=UPI001CA32B56